jgi:hypothetical protein
MCCGGQCGQPLTPGCCGSGDARRQVDRQADRFFRTCAGRRDLDRSRRPEALPPAGDPGPCGRARYLWRRPPRRGAQANAAGRAETNCQGGTQRPDALETGRTPLDEVTSVKVTDCEILASSRALAGRPLPASSPTLWSRRFTIAPRLIGAAWSIMAIVDRDTCR